MASSPDCGIFTQTPKHILNYKRNGERQDEPMPIPEYFTDIAGESKLEINTNNVTSAGTYLFSVDYYFPGEEGTIKNHLDAYDQVSFTIEVINCNEIIFNTPAIDDLTLTKTIILDTVSATFYRN